MTKRAYPFRLALFFSAALLYATVSGRAAWSETIDGRYAGTFGCTQSGPVPEFTAPVAADIIGGKFTMSRQSRFGQESFTGKFDGDGKASIEGGGRGEVTGLGPGEWKYDLNGALSKGRLEANGRMYTRRDPNRRICTLSLARVGGGTDALELAARQKQEQEAAAKQAQETEARRAAEAEAQAQALAQAQAQARQEAELRQKLEAELRARQQAEAKAKQLADAKTKADTDAKAKAEADAKAKVDAEAKIARERQELEDRLRLAEQRAKDAEEKAKQEADARAMAAALLKTGFELIGGDAQLDLDKSKLERAIHEFSRRLRQGTVGLFYYAGHGFEVGGRNYLAPIDANPTSTRDIDFMLVDVDLVLRQLRDADSRLNMVVLDACRNNPFGGAGLRGGGGLAEIKSRPSGTIISFATAAGEVARDGPPGQNSPYTAALVSAILKPGLSVLDTFNDVAISVQRATNREQQPWIQSTGIQGQFFFLPPVGGAPSATPAATAQPSGAMDRDALFWSSVKDSRDPAQLQAYLTQFPDGVYAPLARIWIEDGKRAAKPKP